MIYLSGERLRPYQIRSVAFDTRRRGLDPTQVHDYLSRVADEIDRLHRDLTTANTEAERVRQALRQWQSRHTDCCHHRADAHGAPDVDPRR
ncbi:DivIVA domain-containing protein [Salinispora arenicola]|uniref:DivIVA domain-containing protein n=1 Tax=Salinispora arenicola TaxID=168697 RepID=UPI0000EBA96A|nr:DivIVA domain-containing protein [Salinispora arenicola]